MTARQLITIKGKARPTSGGQAREWKPRGHMILTLLAQTGHQSPQVLTLSGVAAEVLRPAPEGQAACVSSSIQEKGGTYRRLNHFSKKGKKLNLKGSQGKCG